MLSFAEVLDEVSGFSFPIGENDSGNLITANFESAPHLLICGATGTGKSTLVHSILLSLISKNGPDNLRLILCDTKMVEFCEYNGISNLAVPVCTDNKKISGALMWAAHEIDNRFVLLSSARSKTLASYNDHVWENFSEDLELPHLLVVIDDLTPVVSDYPEVIPFIQKILQNGRATGVHLIVVTQTPTWKPIKPLSLMFRNKAVFSFSSKAEESALIGTTKNFGLGACGRCVFSGGGSIQKIETTLPTQTLSSQIIYEKKSEPQNYNQSAICAIEDYLIGKKDQKNDDIKEYDELLPAAIEVVLEVGQASVSMLQRRLKLGYGRAARLVDQMEEKGVVGPFYGSSPRLILITKEQWQEMQFKQGMVDKAPEPECSEYVPQEIDATQYNDEDETDAQKETAYNNHRRRLFGKLFRKKGLE